MDRLLIYFNTQQYYWYLQKVYKLRKYARIKMHHTKLSSCDFYLLQQLEHINQPWSHGRPMILESQLLGKKEPKKKFHFTS